MVVDDHSTDIELFLDIVKETNITFLLTFYKAELDKVFIQDDYYELSNYP